MNGGVGVGASRVLRLAKFRLALERRVDIRLRPRAPRVLHARHVGLLLHHLAEFHLDVRAARLLGGDEPGGILRHASESRLERVPAVVLVAATRVLLLGGASKRILRLGSATLLARAAIRLGARALGHLKFPLRATRLEFLRQLDEFLLEGSRLRLDRRASRVLLLLRGALLLLRSANRRLRLAASRLLLGANRRLRASRVFLGERRRAIEVGVELFSSAFLPLGDLRVGEEQSLELHLRGSAAVIFLGAFQRLFARGVLERASRGGDVGILLRATSRLLLGERAILLRGGGGGGGVRLPRGALGVQRDLGVGGCGGASRTELGVHGAERAEHLVVLLRGGGATRILLLAASFLFGGGLDGGGTRGGATRILLLHRLAFLLDSLLRLVPRARASFVFVRDASAFLFDGVAKRGDGGVSAPILLVAAARLRRRRRRHRFVGGGASRILGFASRALGFGATFGVVVRRFSSRLLHREDARRLGVFPFGVGGGGARGGFRLRSRARLRGGESLLRSLRLAAALILREPRLNLILRHASHVLVSGASSRVLLCATFRLLVHRAFSVGERGGATRLLLLAEFAFLVEARRRRRLGGESTRVLLQETFLRRLFERGGGGFHLRASLILLLALLRLATRRLRLRRVRGASAFILAFATRAFIVRRLLRGGVGGVATRVFVGGAFRLEFARALRIRLGAFATRILRLSRALFLLRRALQRRLRGGSATFLLLDRRLEFAKGAHRLRLELGASAFFPLEKRRVLRLERVQRVNRRLFARLFFGARARLRLSRRRHLSLGEFAATTLSLLGVLRGARAALGVERELRATRGDGSFQILEVAQRGARGVVRRGAALVLLGDARLFRARAFARGVRGVRATRVFGGASFVLLGEKSCALLHRRRGDGALGVRAPRLLLEAHVRLLVRHLAKSRERVESSRVDVCGESRGVVAERPHALDELESSLLLDVASRPLLPLERHELELPRLAALRLGRETCLLLLAHRLDAFVEGGASFAFRLRRGVEFRLRARYIRLRLFAARPLALDRRRLLLAAHRRLARDGRLGGLDRLRGGGDERAKSRDFIVGGAATRLLPLARAILILNHAAEIRLGERAARIFLRATTRLFLRVEARLRVVLRAAFVLPRAEPRLGVRHGKHRNVHHGGGAPRAHGERPVTKLGELLVLLAKLLGGFAREVGGRARLRLRRLLRGDGRVGGFRGVDATRARLVDEFVHAARQRVARSEPGVALFLERRFDGGAIFLALVFEEEPRLGEFVGDIGGGEVRLGEEFLGAHRLVPNLAHRLFPAHLDVVLEHLLFLGGRLLQGADRRVLGFTRGRERRLDAIGDALVKTTRGVEVDVIHVRRRRRRALRRGRERAVDVRVHLARASLDDGGGDHLRRVADDHLLGGCRHLLRRLLVHSVGPGRRLDASRGRRVIRTRRRVRAVDVILRLSRRGFPGEPRLLRRLGGFSARQALLLSHRRRLRARHLERLGRGDEREEEVRGERGGGGDEGRVLRVEHVPRDERRDVSARGGEISANLDDAGRRPDEHGEQRARVDTSAVIVGTPGGAVRERFAVDETIAAEPVVGDDDARRRRDEQ